MVENFIRIFLRSQFGDVRRRTKGAVLEAAALGMVGLSTVFLFIASFLWLSRLIDPWLAALLLSGISFILAAILMIWGNALLRRKTPDPGEQMVSAMKAMGLVPLGDPADKESDDARQDPALTMIAAALAAGLLLERSVNR